MVAVPVSPPRAHRDQPQRSRPAFASMSAPPGSNVPSWGNRPEAAPVADHQLRQAAPVRSGKENFHCPERAVVLRPALVREERGQGRGQAFTYLALVPASSLTMIVCGRVRSVLTCHGTWPHPVDIHLGGPGTPDKSNSCGIQTIGPLALLRQRASRDHRVSSAFCARRCPWPPDLMT